MKKLFTLFLLVSLQTLFAQQPYYNNVNLNLTGQDLYFALQQKIENASSSFNYGDTKESMKITDEDPANNNNVLLLYGYDDNEEAVLQTAAVTKPILEAEHVNTIVNILLPAPTQTLQWVMQIIVLQVLWQIRITFVLLTNK